MLSKVLSTVRYHRVRGEDELALDKVSPHCSCSNTKYNARLWQSLSLLSAVTFAAIIGFLIGTRSPQPGHTEMSMPSWAVSLPRAPVSHSKEIWQQNRTYSRPPPIDNSTEPNWEALIPKGQGFVRYPIDNSLVQAVSAVHQIHCLYAIRRAYYKVFVPEAPIAGINEEHLGEPHLRHCFDYLRQALMCAADSSLEPFDPRLSGVTGWGFPRMCRNYGELLQWSEKYRTNNLEGYMEVVKHPGNHHHPGGIVE